MLRRMAILSVCLTLALTQAAQAQNSKANPYSKPATSAVVNAGVTSAEPAKLVCTVYPLEQICDDAKMGEWIAATLPEVVQPKSWSSVGGAGILKYYGPSKLLIVCQTSAVHSDVEAFLKKLPRSAAANKQAAMPSTPGLVPAQFVPTIAPEAMAHGKGYPIPTPAQPPKHLFHFVIRYEGDSILESGVAALQQSLTGDAGEAVVAGQAKIDASKKPPSSNQLFNIILRYEGEGIIDKNVVEFFKVMQESGGGGCSPIRNCVPSCPTPLNVDVQTSSSPAYVGGPIPTNLAIPPLPITPQGLTPSTIPGIPAAVPVPLAPPAPRASPVA